MKTKYSDRDVPSSAMVPENHVRPRSRGTAPCYGDVRTKHGGGSGALC